MADGIQKISIEDWQVIVSDEFTTDAEVLSISIIVTGDWGFDLGIEPDPNRVKVPQSWYEEENAFLWANNRARRKRKKKFEKRLREGDTSPVLVTEADSWGQFPLLVDDVVDYLNVNGFNCWSMGAAGDTLENMVYGPVTTGSQEYMLGLQQQKSLVRAFVFSAAGNDIIGEHPDTGEAALNSLVNSFNGNEADVDGHINKAVLAATLDKLKSAYFEVVNTIRADPSFRNLPIVFHGYDVPFPYPWGSKDKRSPIYLHKSKYDKWLGSVFKAKGIKNDDLRRAILAKLIDALYDTLYSIAGNSRKSHVWVVNCRGALPKVSDWNDEIHGTSRGFGKVSGRFIAILQQAIKNAEGAS